MAKHKSNPIQQASKLLDAKPIAPMSPAEARRATDDIVRHTEEAYLLVVELHDREGWKALGYTSWAGCCASEFQFSRQRGYQLLSTARVRKNVAMLPSKTDEVSTIGRHLPNERQARELAKVEPQQQAEVWQQAVDTAPGHQPTAKQVASIVRQSYTPVTRPAPKPVSGRRTGVGGRPGDTRTRCKALLDRASERLVEEVYQWLAERLGEPVETGEFAG